MSGKKSDDGREWTGTDLVDRHKVVLALDRIKMRGDETWYDYYHKALNAMAKLPPIDIREQLDNAYMHGATEAEAKYRAILDTMPQVVRCKDCKWWHDWNGECYGNGNMGYGARRKADDFCSWGKRKKMRLIDACALQEEYKARHGGKRLLLIDVAPTVDAVPVRRGKWILQGDRRKTLYGWYFCSECGACIGGKANFCSECGADMREDDGMMLYDKTLQWIYDHTDDFKRAIVALDFAKQARCTRDDGVFRKADEAVHDYSLSFLLMAMGEHPPKTLWSARDYSVLYGVIMDNSDDNEIRDDQ